MAYPTDTARSEPITVNATLTDLGAWDVRDTRALSLVLENEGLEAVTPGDSVPWLNLAPSADSAIESPKARELDLGEDNKRDYTDRQAGFFLRAVL